MSLQEGYKFIVVHPGIDLRNRCPRERPMRADVLNKHLRAVPVCDQRVFRKWRICEIPQIVDVIQARVAEPQPENVQYSFGAMDSATVVCKANAQHLIAQRSGHSKHLDQLQWFVLPVSCHLEAQKVCCVSVTRVGEACGAA